MILFVIVTAVLNIGLGYALAIYLGRARGIKGYRSPAVQENDADAPTTALACQTAPAPTIVSPAALPVTAEAPGAELEQDVLAGIEEFRNQLAQMKAQPVEASAVAAGP